MNQYPVRPSVEFTVAQELVVLIAGFAIQDPIFKRLLVENGIAQLEENGETRLSEPS